MTTCWENGIYGPASFGEGPVKLLFSLNNHHQDLSRRINHTLYIGLRQVSFADGIDSFDRSGYRGRQVYVH